MSQRRIPHLIGNAVALSLLATSAAAQSPTAGPESCAEDHTSFSQYYGLWMFEPGAYHPYRDPFWLQREAPRPLTVYVSHCPGIEPGEISRRYFLFTGDGHADKAERALNAFTNDERLECGEEIRSTFLTASNFSIKLSLFFVGSQLLTLTEGPVWGPGENERIAPRHRFNIVPLGYWLERPDPCVEDCWRDDALVSASSMLGRLGVHHGPQAWGLIEDDVIEASYESRRGYAAELYAFGKLRMKRVKAYPLPPCS